MKISKLFHWLYAFLMLLPILSIPVFMIYSHRHSVADNVPTLETTYKYQSNEVETIDDLVVDNVYSYNTNEKSIWQLCPDNGDYVLFKLLTPLSVDYGTSVEEVFPFEYFSSDTILLFYNAQSVVYIDVYYSLEQYYDSDYSIAYIYDDIFYSDCVVQLLDYHYYEPLLSFEPQFSYTDYNEIESANISYTNNVINVFYNEYQNALDTTLSITGNVGLSINNAYSYLVTNLFGISNSGLGLIIVKLLTYWTIISIVYLIFDILMFLPLLAHKWIDKARME